MMTFAAGVLVGVIAAGFVGWSAWYRERVNLRFVQAWNRRILEDASRVELER